MMSKRQFVDSNQQRYTTAAQALLTLYGSRARDVKPPRTIYDYVAIEPVPDLHSDYLVPALNDHELAQLEALTRRHAGPHAYIFRWRESQWQAFPTQHNPQYSLSLTLKPRCWPQNAVPLSASSDDGEGATEDSAVDASDEITQVLTGDGIHITRSQRAHRRHGSGLAAAKRSCTARP
jgi:hypothetical protein